jgi:hypothetical protein
MVAQNRTAQGAMWPDLDFLLRAQKSGKRFQKWIRCCICSKAERRSSRHHGGRCQQRQGEKFQRHRKPGGRNRKVRPRMSTPTFWRRRLQHFPDCVIDWPIGKLRGNGETESIQDDHYCPRQGFSIETPSRQEKESLAQSLIRSLPRAGYSGEEVLQASVGIFFVLFFQDCWRNALRGRCVIQHHSPMIRAIPRLFQFQRT